MNRRRLVARVYPPSDRGLELDLLEAVEALDDPDLSDDELRVVVEERLRAWYPNVRIRAQTSLGRVGPGLTPSWYVLRDRRVRPSNPQRDRLYAALGTSRLSAATAARAVDSAGKVIDDARDAVTRSRQRRHTVDRGAAGAAPGSPAPRPSI